MSDWMSELESFGWKESQVKIGKYTESNIGLSEKSKKLVLSLDLLWCMTMLRGPSDDDDDDERQRIIGVKW